jgi:hypothetical protein
MWSAGNPSPASTNQNNVARMQRRKRTIEGSEAALVMLGRSYLFVPNDPGFGQLLIGNRVRPDQNRWPLSATTPARKCFAS